jgi:hypothetical protein
VWQLSVPGLLDEFLTKKDGLFAKDVTSQIQPFGMGESELFFGFVFLAPFLFP